MNDRPFLNLAALLGRIFVVSMSIAAVVLGVVLLALAIVL
jgi:hypothetical protein